MGSLLARLGNNIDVPATKISSPQHLEITSFATDQTVAPGTHFSLVLRYQTSGSRARVRTWRHRLQADRAHRPAEAWPDRHGDALPQGRGLLLQTAQRARPRIPEAISHRAGRGDRSVARRRERAEGHDGDDDQWGADATRRATTSSASPRNQCRSRGPSICDSWIASARSRDVAAGLIHSALSAGAYLRREWLAASPSHKGAIACLASSSATSTRPSSTSGPSSPSSSKCSATAASCRIGSEPSFSFRGGDAGWPVF